MVYDRDNCAATPLWMEGRAWDGHGAAPVSYLESIARTTGMFARDRRPEITPLR
jgi:hypothetical protein